MHLRSYNIARSNNFKPFKLQLYEGAQVVGFEDMEGVSDLYVLEAIGGDFYETRLFCLHKVGGAEIPEGAKFIAMCKGKYWTPFALFEVTDCKIDDPS